MQQENNRQGRGAPLKNDNASNKRKGLPDGYYTKFFTNGKFTAKLVDRLTAELGHKPSIEELRAKSKEIYFNGLSEYLEN